MKKVFYTYIFFISTFASLFFGCVTVYADTQISSDVATDTTWNLEGSPYIVQGGVTVDEEATLTIDPGVAVKFENGTDGLSGSLTVLGSIHCNGTFAKPVSFSSVSSDTDWNLPIINSASTFSYVTISGSSQAIFGMNSNLKIDHLTAADLTGPALMFNDSKVDISSSDFGNGARMLELWNNSAVSVSDSKFHDVADQIGAIAAYGNSSLTMQNDVVQQITKGDAVAVYNDANATISSSTIEYGVGNGVTAYNNGKVSLKNSEIRDFAEDGIVAYSGARVSLDHDLVTKNNIGLEMYSGPVAFNANATDVYGNSTYGILNYSGSNIDASNIWWGDVGGPHVKVFDSDEVVDAGNEINNAVSDNVSFDPWLTEDPLVTPKCCSNVAFIPGLEASRLYAPGLLSENKLWEPNRNADAEKLYMNASGTSIRTDIYTRDIIGDVGALFFKSDVYSGFEKYMNGLVTDKTINSWKALPYDWRLGLGDVVNGGAQDANGDISYLSGTTPEISYMILSLDELSRSAKNGKVTLVTHSNGGLVAKVLIQKLQDLKAQGKSDLIDHIDKVVMVAAPQFGSADAITSLLHGYKLNYLGGLILDESHGRAMAENMLGAYNLLPSRKYFDQIKEPIVTFSTSTDSLSTFSKFYGRAITDYSTFENFLIGADGRKDPAFSDTYTPNVLNKKILTSAETQHANIDNWQFPASIDVVQLAGWGVQTLKSVQYDKESVCNNSLVGIIGACKDTLVMKPSFSVEGDGTVLYPSAVESKGKQLYFNIKKYNAPGAGPKQNRAHSDIFETSSVENLVRNILIGTSTLPEYITDAKPTAKDGKLLVSVTSSTTLSVKDFSGNHTGIIDNPDPGSDIKVLEQNVPNSFYSDFGEIKYIGLDTDTPAQITFQGGGYGTFTLNSTVTQGDAAISTSMFTDIPVTPQMQGEILNATSSIPTLAIDVDGDGTFEATTTPVQSFDPVLYMEIMKKTVESFGLKKLPEKVLVTKLDQLENLVKKGKIKNVEKQVQKFTKKIDRKNNRLRKITDDERNQIVQMLSDLVNNLL